MKSKFHVTVAFLKASLHRKWWIACKFQLHHAFATVLHPIVWDVDQSPRVPWKVKSFKKLPTRTRCLEHRSKAFWENQEPVTSWWRARSPEFLDNTKRSTTYSRQIWKIARTWIRNSVGLTVLLGRFMSKIVQLIWICGTRGFTSISFIRLVLLITYERKRQGQSAP